MKIKKDKEIITYVITDKNILNKDIGNFVKKISIRP